MDRNKLASLLSNVIPYSGTEILSIVIGPATPANGVGATHLVDITTPHPGGLGIKTVHIVADEHGYPLAMNNTVETIPAPAPKGFTNG